MATSKLGWGQGTVFQRPDGKWIGRYYDGYLRSGAPRKREVSGPSEDAVKAKLRKVQRDRAAAAKNTSPSVKAWSTQYLELQEERRRPSSVTTTRWALGYIVQEIGAVKLARVTPADIRKVTRAMRRQGLAESSQKRAHIALMAMLRAAVADGHDVPREALAVETPAAKRSDRADIPLEHAVKILKVIAERKDRAMWLIPLFAGLRLSEDRGLTADRLDFDRKLILVDRQMQEPPWRHGCDGTCGEKPRACPEREHAVPLGYEYTEVQDHHILGPTKSVAGVRPVPMVSIVEAALRELPERKPDELVFQRPGGGPLTKQMMTTQWHDIQEAAGVRHASGRYYGIHECRHTCATMLMALGVPLPVIQAIIGDSSVIATLTYLHVDTETARKALTEVERSLQLDA